jgi:hypothetical protein
MRMSMPIHGFAHRPMNVLFADQFGDLGGAQLCMRDLMPAIVPNASDCRGGLASIRRPALWAFCRTAKADRSESYRFGGWNVSFGK